MFALFSCNRIRRKGQEMIDRAGAKISQHKETAVDKVIPYFDSNKPDTRFNKLRFEEFFGFPPTPDVKNIYCYGDRMGIDAKFMFSFQCDTTTRNRIVTQLKLQESKRPNNFSSGSWPAFYWWDSEKIATLNPYFLKVGHKYHRYLWFDKDRQMLYYLDFDL
jgi:hypothetical protein